jgi:ribose transport system permease protein
MTANLRKRELWTALGPYLGLILVFAFFAVRVPEYFLTERNFQDVATQTVIVAIGAMGMTFIVISGGIDLSVGSQIALGSVVAALTMKTTGNAAIAIAAGVGVGGLCGVLNGILITSLGVVPFIVTLGMLGVARGTAKFLADEQRLNVDPGFIESIMAKQPVFDWMLVGPGVWLMFILAIGAAVVLRYSVLGLHTYAIGSNEATARLCGVRVKRTKIVLYSLCGLFAGLAGVLQYSRLNVGDPTTAVGLELDIIAAVVIGGGSLSGGAGSLSGSLVGAFIMAILANGCTLIELPNYVQEILIGVIIVAAVALDRFRGRSPG